MPFATFQVSWGAKAFQIDDFETCVGFTFEIFPAEIVVFLSKDSHILALNLSPLANFPL